MFLSKINRITTSKRGIGGTHIILGAAVLIAIMVFAGPMIFSHLPGGDGEGDGLIRTLPLKVQSTDTCDRTDVDDKVAIWSADGTTLLETVTASSGVATTNHMYTSEDVVDIYGYSATDASYYDYYMNDVVIPRAPNDQVSYHYISESLYMTDAISETNLKIYGYAGGALKAAESSSADISFFF